MGIGTTAIATLVPSREPNFGKALGAGAPAGMGREGNGCRSMASQRSIDDNVLTTTTMLTATMTTTTKMSRTAMTTTRFAIWGGAGFNESIKLDGH